MDGERKEMRLGLEERVFSKYWRVRQVSYQELKEIYSQKESWLASEKEDNKLYNIPEGFNRFLDEQQPNILDTALCCILAWL